MITTPFPMAIFEYLEALNTSVCHPSLPRYSSAVAALEPRFQAIQPGIEVAYFKSLITVRKFDRANRALNL